MATNLFLCLPLCSTVMDSSQEIFQETDLYSIVSDKSIFILYMIIPALVRRSWNKLAFRGDSVYVREIYVNIHILAPCSFMISRRAFLSFQLLYYCSRIILKCSATYLTKYTEHQQFASVDSYKSTLKLIRWSEI